MHNKDKVLNRLYRAIELYRELGFEYLPLKKDDVEGFLKRNVAREAYPSPKLKKEAAVWQGNKADGLKVLKDKISDCKRCKLSETRNNIVFGEGSPNADIMFIGEGPGREEDLQARPFVGDAGKLLTNLIVKLGLKREDVYIANIVKCRPPGNRNPEDDEVASCSSFVEEQIGMIRPKVIVCLGRIAAQALLKVKTPISRMRGNFFQYSDIPVMPTFHPAYLLRTPKDKWLTWDDMQKVLKKLG
ncbi:MAG TPA: uracil-DNA glycosylase [Nitrospirae bacterium]|nr:uracil DNA glycosylase superfamily protein [bacterium BMS3Abin09]GBE40343.1 uracil DNA glycosylase superfamily protein [bacterium BMS3Bbin09]HDH33859.1 uracil-DNA glycosylase [Nitrospirota bacterium]HDN95208.1 uracil-DNA glycosylase [Nitrospirota bacterium]HDO67103.1 uracil-DNA glycosylase [Nitrospirota bacterium]